MLTRFFLRDERFGGPVNETGTTAINAHNKDEYPPMHTAEHVLNQTMVRMFGCSRAVGAHIERKKSKCDYELDREPTFEEVAEIERRVNEVLARDLPVTVEFMSQAAAAGIVDLARLPEGASDTVRIVRIGDYDVCACAGSHVANTREIAPSFRIVSADWADGRWRVRFKLEA